MPQKTAWEQFLDGHALVYGSNVLTKNGVGEVDILLEELRK